MQVATTQNNGIFPSRETRYKKLSTIAFIYIINTYMFIYYSLNREKLFEKNDTDILINDGQIMDLVDFGTSRVFFYYLFSRVFILSLILG